MAITFPNVFSDGVAAVAEEVSDNIFKAETTPNSLEVLNGRLDNTYLTGVKPQIQRRAVAPGAFVDVGQQGATTALDYFSPVFGGWNPTNDDETLYLPIPGACLTFNVTETMLAMRFSWNLFIESSQVGVTPAVQVEFRLTRPDGTVIKDHKDRLPEPDAIARLGLESARHFCRQMTVESFAGSQLGEYHAGLYLASDAEQVRVHRRSIRVLGIKL